MPSFFLSTNALGRETEKACQFICPATSRYPYYRFWLSKRFAKIHHLGTYRYIELNIGLTQEYELTRYSSKSKQPQRVCVKGQDIWDMFSVERNLMPMRIEHYRQASADDRAFERTMRAQEQETRTFNPFNLSDTF